LLLPFISIGRSDTHSDIVIESKKISKRHLAIVYDELHKSFWLINYSKNGTWVNNNKITNEPLLLNGLQKVSILLENPIYDDQIEFKFKIKNSKLL
jgi:pSer/pThr/pTyr-binding forkhead associated (FHA) protein